MQNPLIIRLFYKIKKILYRTFLVILPRAYKDEAIELMTQEMAATSRIRDRAAIFLGYLAGAMSYRLRKIWIPVISFPQLLLVLIAAAGRLEPRVPLSERH